VTESSVPVESATTRSRRRRRRTWTRRLLWALVVGIVVVVSYVGITFVQVVHTSHRDDARSSSAPKAQAVIVLGAAQYNGRPSPVLEARLAHALQLYRWGLAPVMVVTGGRRPGDRYTEATTGYNYLRAHGVPDSAIRKEVKGGTTWESLQAAARFLHAEHIDHVILVSDGYHSLRLLEIAGEVGLHARVSPSRERLSRATRLHYQLRETVAVAIGRVTGFHLLDRR
jgi:vancomycin permeability regulator SanA